MIRTNKALHVLACDLSSIQQTNLTAASCSKPVVLSQFLGDGPRGLQVAFDIASALAYLHSINIVHLVLSSTLRIKSYLWTYLVL